jgi:hypothetical protein
MGRRVFRRGCQRQLIEGATRELPLPRQRRNLGDAEWLGKTRRYLRPCCLRLYWSACLIHYTNVRVSSGKLDMDCAIFSLGTSRQRFQRHIFALSVFIYHGAYHARPISHVGSVKRRDGENRSASLVDARPTSATKKGPPRSEYAYADANAAPTPYETANR